jgi:hypothetical protein
MLCRYDRALHVSGSSRFLSKIPQVTKGQRRGRHTNDHTIWHYPLPLSLQLQRVIPIDAFRILDIYYVDLCSERLLRFFQWPGLVLTDGEQTMVVCYPCMPMVVCGDTNVGMLDPGPCETAY